MPEALAESNQGEEQDGINEQATSLRTGDSCSYSCECSNFLQPLQESPSSSCTVAIRRSCRIGNCHYPLRSYSEFGVLVEVSAKVDLMH